MRLVGGSHLNKQINRLNTQSPMWKITHFKNDIFYQGTKDWAYGEGVKVCN